MNTVETMKRRMARSRKAGLSVVFDGEIGWYEWQFPTPDRRDAFIKRLEENGTAYHVPAWQTA